MGAVQIDEPRTTAQHPQAATAVGPCTTVFRRAAVRVIPAILRPFPNVADHVVQTKTIRLVRAHRRGMCICFIAGSARGGGYVGVPTAVRAECLAPIVCRSLPRPRSIFPLRFAQQPVVLAGLFGEPLRLGIGVMPVNAYHRMVVALGKTWVLPIAVAVGLVAAVGNEPGKLRARDFGSTDH